MERYRKDVVNVFVEIGAYDEKKKAMMIRKLEWVLTNHKTLDAFPYLPLLTPSTLTCMGEAFTQVSNAMNEVSHFIDLMMITNVIRHTIGDCTLSTLLSAG